VCRRTACFSAARLELEADKRVEAGGPSGRTPGLDDPPTGYQFNVTAFDEAAKHRKRTAGRWIDGRRQAAEGGELLLIEEILVKPLRLALKSIS